MERWIRSARRALSCGACLLCAAISFEGAARAEGFRYVDRDGIAHDINVPGASAAAPAPVAPARPGEADYPHAAAVREAAQLYSLPVELVLAVMTIESGFDPSAVSPRGAMGLMQLMPATAAEMRVANPYDPRESTLGGARYLRILLNGADGDVTLALGAYHAGAGASQRHGGVPPFPDTRRYVASVVRFYRIYQERGPSYAAVIAASINSPRSSPRERPAIRDKKGAIPSTDPKPHDPAPRGGKGPEIPRARGVDSADAAVVHAEGFRARSRHGKERARPRRPMKRRSGDG